ncbi:MAG: hypothetical protein NTW19_14525 [Planctomycetota bacterium]|nr:hypothetical protein [Planctomycetota bacterium]
MAPIATPTGPHEGDLAGVRAYLFSCTDCGDAESVFVGYLEKMDSVTFNEIRPEAKKNWYTSNISRGGGMGFVETPLIKRIKDTEWIAKETEAGAELMAAAVKKCSDPETLQECPAPSPKQPGTP